MPANHTDDTENSLYNEYQCNGINSEALIQNTDTETHEENFIFHISYTENRTRDLLNQRSLFEPLSYRACQTNYRFVGKHLDYRVFSVAATNFSEVVDPKYRYTII